MRTSRAVVITVAVVLLLLAGRPAGAEEKSRMAVVLEWAKLIVVTLTTVPPFAFNDDKGQLVGFDIDIARLVATALFKDPIKVEVVSVSAEGRWPAIESGRADMGVGGPTTYPARAIRVAFTRPFVDSGISVLVAKKSGIKSVKDLDQDKFTVANLNNPQMADRAKRFFPRAKVLTFDTPSAQFLAVKSGRANALQIDTPSAEYWAAQNKDEMDVLPGLLGASQNNGIFLRTGDFKWWLWLDTAVAEMRTGSWYPQYSEIYHKWFGKNPPPQKFYNPQ